MLPASLVQSCLLGPERVGALRERAAQPGPGSRWRPAGPDSSAGPFGPLGSVQRPALSAAGLGLVKGEGELRGLASAQPACGWGLVGRGPGGTTSPPSQATPVRHLERVLGQRARPPPAWPGPALAASSGLARGWPAALRARSRAGGAEARSQGASLLGVTGGRAGGPRLGEWGWTRGPSLTASSSTGHRFCQKAFRWHADGRASRLPPVTARPRHDLDRTAGRPLQLRPLTSPSRPSLRLARGSGGLADSRRRWCRARLPGGRRGDDVSP